MLTPDEVLDELAGWDVHPADPTASYAKADYETLLRDRSEGALFKGIDDRHLTSSLFVLSPDLTQVLLAFHKKAQMWLQFGGHLERGDGSLKAAAWREGEEESGLEGFADFIETPSDLDIHALGTGFEGVCTEHWDIGFVAIAELDSTTAVSDESEGLGWFPVGDLPGGSAGNMYPRIEAAVARAREFGYPRVETEVQ